MKKISLKIPYLEPAKLAQKGEQKLVGMCQLGIFILTFFMHELTFEFYSLEHN